MKTGIQNKYGVLLINMGGPLTLDDIEAYLVRLMSDPRLIQMPLPYFIQKRLGAYIAHKRAPKVRERYALIGGGSPLLEQTQAQADALAKDCGLPAKVAMSYSPPLIDDVVAEFKEEGVDTLILLPLYPQYSNSTTGSALSDARSAAQQRGLKVGQIESHYDSPGFIEALQDLLLKALAEDTGGVQSTQVIFVAHSLPEKYIRKGDPYESQLKKTRDLTAKALPLGIKHHLAYTSRMGPMKWLGPTLEDEIKRLAQEGVKRLVIQTLSFVSEHLETLYDLDIEASRLAEELKVEFVRVPTVGTHPAYIKGLSCLVESKIKLEGKDND